MTNINFTSLAASEAKLVLALVLNGEVERALRHSRLLVSFLEGECEQSGIETMPFHIHDSTPA